MIYYDLHCHSKLSACASRDSEIDDFIKYAEEDGLAAIGISDHAWDKGLGRPIGFYEMQPYEPLFERVGKSKKIKVFMGAEGEYAEGLLGVRRETMKKLDYIIIPHSHTHMKGFVLPDGIVDPFSHGRYLFASCMSLLHHPDTDLIFGIAHPFVPVGKKYAEVEEILKSITDEEFEYIGRLASDKGIFLELNTACLSLIPIEEAGSSQYARFVRNAKKGGAKFFTGSDNHKPVKKSENRFFALPCYMEEFGLVESDIKDALNRILRA